MGYQIVQLPEADPASVDVGLKYTNNEICYPGIITIGDIVKALQSGNYDLDSTAVGFSQTGGQCRATSYPSMIKKALVAAGFEQRAGGHPLHQPERVQRPARLAVQPRRLHLQSRPGHDVQRRPLADVPHHHHPRAPQRRGASRRRPLPDGVHGRGQSPSPRPASCETLERAVQEFNAIETLPGSHPRVGIVGEIYVKYNAFSNNHVAHWLMEQGLEVVMPSFFEFFDGALISACNGVNTNVKKRDTLWLLTLLGQRLVGYFQHQFAAVMQGYRRYHPHPDIQRHRLLGAGDPQPQPPVRRGLADRRRDRRLRALGRAQRALPAALRLHRQPRHRQGRAEAPAGAVPRSSTCSSWTPTPASARSISSTACTSSSTTPRAPRYPWVTDSRKNNHSRRFAPAVIVIFGLSIPG